MSWVLPQYEVNRLEVVLPQNELNHPENSSTALMFCHSTNLIAWRMIMVYHWAKSADQRFVISLRGVHVFLIGAHLRCYFLLLFFSANGISKWQHIKLATCQTFKNMDQIIELTSYCRKKSYQLVNNMWCLLFVLPHHLPGSSEVHHHISQRSPNDLLTIDSV